MNQIKEVSINLEQILRAVQSGESINWAMILIKELARKGEL